MPHTVRQHTRKTASGGTTTVRQHTRRGGGKKQSKPPRQNPVSRYFARRRAVAQERQRVLDGFGWADETESADDVRSFWSGEEKGERKPGHRQTFGEALRKSRASYDDRKAAETELRQAHEALDRIPGPDETDEYLRANERVAQAEDRLREARGRKTPKWRREEQERVAQREAAEREAATSPGHEPGEELDWMAWASDEQRAKFRAFDEMADNMRAWRARPEPKPGPAKPMTPQMAKLLGCDTPEGLALFERGRAYREAGYDGPLDEHNRIPDPDNPANRESLTTLSELKRRS